MRTVLFTLFGVWILILSAEQALAKADNSPAAGPIIGGKVAQVAAIPVSDPSFKTIWGWYDSNFGDGNLCWKANIDSLNQHIVIAKGANWTNRLRQRDTVYVHMVAPQQTNIVESDYEIAIDSAYLPFLSVEPEILDPDTVAHEEKIAIVYSSDDAFFDGEIAHMLELVLPSLSNFAFFVEFLIIIMLYFAAKRIAATKFAHNVAVVATMTLVLFPSAFGDRSIIHMPRFSELKPQMFGAIHFHDNGHDEWLEQSEPMTASPEVVSLLDSLHLPFKYDSTRWVTSIPCAKRYHKKHKVVRRHRGYDFALQRGTPVLAAAAGVVTSTGRKGGYGHRVEISHFDGQVITISAHLLGRSIIVSSGDTVQVGQVIARSSNSGVVFSNHGGHGYHLHFEVISFDNGAWGPVKPWIISRPGYRIAPEVTNFSEGLPEVTEEEYIRQRKSPDFTLSI